MLNPDRWWWRWLRYPLRLAPDWVCSWLCDVAAWWDKPVWRKRRAEMVYVNARPGSIIELPVWDDRRQMRFERWPGARHKVIVCDGWRPGRYV